MFNKALRVSPGPVTKVSTQNPFRQLTPMVVNSHPEIRFWLRQVLSVSLRQRVRPSCLAATISSRHCPTSVAAHGSNHNLFSSAKRAAPKPLDFWFYQPGHDVRPTASYIEPLTDLANTPAWAGSSAPQINRLARSCEVQTQGT